MKIGILSLSKDYKKIGTSGGYPEFVFAKRELSKLGEVIVLDKDNIKCLNSEDFHFFFLFSSQVNFFGGKLNQHVIDKWNFIAQSERPIFYWFWDTAIPLNNLCQTIHDRFGIDICSIQSDCLIVIHQFSKDIIDYWLHSAKNQHVLRHNFHYFDLTISYFIDVLQPSIPISEIVYIGNYRSGRRTKQLIKYSQDIKINLYGNWNGKIDEMNVNWLGTVTEDRVKKTLNAYFGQLILADREYIKYKQVSNGRLVLTVLSGTLPLIDEVFLSYHEIPDFARELVISNCNDIKMILKMNKNKRYELICKYQDHFKMKFDNLDFSYFIKEIYDEL